MTDIANIRIVVCLGTQETLAHSHGVGHALIEAITQKELHHALPTRSITTSSNLTQKDFLLDYPEHHLSVLLGIPSAFFGAGKDVCMRAAALAHHLHQKIMTEQEESPKLFLYGYSRGCLILLKALHLLQSKLTSAQLHKLQIHLLLNDPIPGGVALTQEELALPSFIKRADVIYLKHEQRFFFEALTGLYSLDKKTKTTITFLNGNHTSATRVPPSEIGLSTPAVDEITHIVSDSLQQLGYKGNPLSVFELKARGEKPTRRPMSPTKAQQCDEESFYQKAAAAERAKNNLRYFPKSTRFSLTKGLENFIAGIFHDFDTDLNAIKRAIDEKLALLPKKSQSTIQVQLQCLLAISTQLSVLRNHIEKAKNRSNRLLIAEHFQPCLRSLEQLTQNVIHQQESSQDALEQLITNLNTIATHSKHQSEARRIALLICKMAISLIPPIGLFLAYHGMFNYKTQTSLYAENTLSKAYAFSKLTPISV